LYGDAPHAPTRAEKAPLAFFPTFRPAPRPQPARTSVRPLTSPLVRPEHLFARTLVRTTTEHLFAQRLSTALSTAQVIHTFIHRTPVRRTSVRLHSLGVPNTCSLQLLPTTMVADHNSCALQVSPDPRKGSLYTLARGHLCPSSRAFVGTQGVTRCPESLASVGNGWQGRRGGREAHRAF